MKYYYIGLFEGAYKIFPKFSTACRHQVFESTIGFYNWTHEKSALGSCSALISLLPQSGTEKLFGTFFKRMAICMSRVSNDLCFGQESEFEDTGQQSHPH